MELNRRFFHVAFVLLASLVLASCTSGLRLAAQSAQDTEVSGTYNVIFYGCNYLNDPESVVFLDKDSDQYTFEPFAPDFNYRIKKGMSAAEAFAATEKFLDCSTGFRNTRLRRIITPGNEVIGYEIRPLYYSFIYGHDNVLSVDYRLRDGKVIIMINLDPSVERRLRDGGLNRFR